MSRAFFVVGVEDCRKLRVHAVTFRLKAFDVFPELPDLQTQGNTLFAVHAHISLVQFEKGLEVVVALGKVNGPGLLLLVIVHLEIDVAGAEFRENVLDLPAEFILVVHGFLLCRPFICSARILLCG
jgi:hypothetical protein